MAQPQPSGGFYWTQGPCGETLRCDALEPIAEHFYTTRQLPLRGGELEAAPAWSRVAHAAGVDPATLVRLRQVHGAEVSVVRRGSSPGAAVIPVIPFRKPSERAAADIIATDDPGVAVSVQAADCVPLLLADPRSGAVAAAHAGWRGMKEGVPGAAVAALASEFGAEAADLVAAIGPSIGPCCYSVGPELPAEFARAGHQPGAIARWFSGDPDLRLDLWKATRDLLEAAGLRAANIHLSGLCTATYRELFYSHRREGAGTGRIAAVIRPRAR